MTDTDPQAYRKLCRRWRECQHPDLYWKDDQQAWFTTVCGHRGVDVPTFWVTALIVDHFERLLDKHAPGWAHRSCRSRVHAYDIACPAFTTAFVDESRLSALLSAVEAVLSSKEPRP